MTVVDTSAVIDFLLGDVAGQGVETVLATERVVAAPDLLVFEVVAVLRRQVLRGQIGAERAGGAIDDLADLPVEIYPTLPLRSRAWELRENMTAADALFIALAERLREPLLTKDGHLAAAARTHSSVVVIEVPLDDHEASQRH